MGSSKLLATSAVAVALCVGGSAIAEPTAADKETARGLMAEGRADRDRGDVQGALKAFAAADAIMHVPTTGLELARAQAAVGQLVEALDTALRVARTPERPNEPVPFRVAREAATALDAELEGRVPSLKIVVTGAPQGTSARVTVDGAAVPAELLGQPRKLNPGHHAIVARAGAAEATQEIDVAERESKDVTVELPGPPAPAPAAGETPETPPQNDERPRSGSPLRNAMIWGGFGVAGAGLLLGSITGLVSLSQTSSIKSSGQCLGDNCGPAEFGDISTAQTMATISTVSFIAGGAGALVGLGGLLLSSGASPPASDAPAAANAARIQPWVSVGSVGVAGRF